MPELLGEVLILVVLVGVLLIPLFLQFIKGRKEKKDSTASDSQE